METFTAFHKSLPKDVRYLISQEEFDTQFNVEDGFIYVEPRPPPKLPLHLKLTMKDMLKVKREIVHADIHGVFYCMLKIFKQLQNCARSDVADRIHTVLLDLFLLRALAFNTPSVHFYLCHVLPSMNPVVRVDSDVLDQYGVRVVTNRFHFKPCTYLKHTDAPVRTVPFVPFPKKVYSLFDSGIIFYDPDPENMVVTLGETSSVVNLTLLKMSLNPRLPSKLSVLCTLSGELFLDLGKVGLSSTAYVNTGQIVKALELGKTHVVLLRRHEAKFSPALAWLVDDGECQGGAIYDLFFIEAEPPYISKKKRTASSSSTSSSSSYSSSGGRRTRRMERRKNVQMNVWNGMRG